MYTDSARNLHLVDRGRHDALDPARGLPLSGQILQIQPADQKKGNLMLCPSCGSARKAHVKETRQASDGGIRRRRQCSDCNADFETLEHVSGDRMSVRKSNGTEELFERAKVRKGIIKAAVREHHADRLTELTESITQDARRSAQSDVIDSETLATIVLEHLKEFDPVTHVRYALTQLGRQDQVSGRQRGWKGLRDFRRWLVAAYPQLEHFHPRAKLSYVVKRDDRREPYDRQKLERAVGVASKGRGSSDRTVHDLATNIAEWVEQALSGQTIVTSGQLAAEVLRALRKSDQIAAIRFASTAKRFVSVEDYETEALGLRGSGMA